MAHWLDDIIALIKREGQRFAGSSPEKGAHHETVADLLTAYRDVGVSQEDVKNSLPLTPVRASDATKAEPPTGSPPFAG